MDTSFPKDLETKYECITDLGQGAMGVVYQARQRDLNRLVAIKFLVLGPGVHPTLPARFKKEGQLAARIRHPNVVTVFESGVTSVGQPYIVYEYLEGRSLENYLQRNHPFTIEESLGLMISVLAGLSAIHKAGIVHRDLKSENILIGPGGDPKIVDLGLALDLASEQRMTKEGEFLGTPWYVSPEVISGQEATPLSDLYAVGIMLFELLGGRHPFPAKTVGDCLVAHVKATPPDLEELNPMVSPELSAVVSRTLAKDPRNRPQSATKLIRELQSIPWVSKSPNRTVGAAERRRRATEKTRMKRPSIDLGFLPSRSMQVLWMAALISLVVVGLFWLYGQSPRATVDSEPGRAASPGVAPVDETRLSLKELVVEPERLLVRVEERSGAGTRLTERAFGTPLSFPLTITPQPTDPSLSSGPATLVIHAGEVAVALLRKIQDLRRLLELAPGFGDLNALARSKQGRSELERQGLTERLFKSNTLLDQWRTVRDHAGPLLSARLDLSVREKILDATYRLEDLGSRLESFHIPVPFDLSSVYPQDWRPECPDRDVQGTEYLVEWKVDPKEKTASSHQTDGVFRPDWSKGQTVAASSTLSGKPWKGGPSVGWAKGRLDGKVTVPLIRPGRKCWINCSSAPRTGVLRLWVRINDRITLRLPHGRCFKSEGFVVPGICRHTFDGSILRPGENRIEVEASTCLDIVRGADTVTVERMGIIVSRDGPDDQELRTVGGKGTSRQRIR